MFDMGKEHRKAFFSVLFAAGRKGMYLLPKIIYIYSCYLVDSKRSMHDAKIAREHAKWERENQNKVLVDIAEIPVSEKIREAATPLFNAAYQHVYTHFTNKEGLYTAVISAMVDFNDRFGKTFEKFDQFHEDHLRNCCDRIIATMDIANTEDAPFLPPTAPPGFVREILDALDNAVRYRNMNK